MLPPPNHVEPGDQSANPYPVLPGRPTLLGLAWSITVVASSLPDILWSQLSGGIPSWLDFAKMGLLLGLVLASVVWRPLRPLRNFCLVLLAFFALMALRQRLDFTWPVLQAVFGRNVFDSRMQAEQTGKLVAALAMIAVLLLLGYKRRDFFLTRGYLRAPIHPVPLLGFPKAAPWPVFGLQWGIYIAAALAVMQYLSLRPEGATLLQVVPLLPSILFYAALNAFNEEMIYRAPMLGTLEAVVGSRQALWMAAYFFGIAHYFGTPGGLLGGVASIFMGWILGKAMLETRGLFWAWWIHFLSDIAIFFFLSAALLA